MIQFLGGLLLTGVLGYIPYKYLAMIGLVSEKNNSINTPILLLFSIQTVLLWYFTFLLFLGNNGINKLKELYYVNLILPTITFIGVFLIVIFLLNPLMINFAIKAINFTREKLKLDYMSILDKRDKLFNNNRKPVFIVLRNFENEIVNEGELLTYNSSTSDFDFLEIKKQNFSVSNLPDEDELYIKHTVVDLKQQIKMDLFLMKNG